MKKKPSEIFEKVWEKDLIRRGVLSKCEACEQEGMVLPITKEHTCHQLNECNHNWELGTNGYICKKCLVYKETEKVECEHCWCGKEWDIGKFKPEGVGECKHKWKHLLNDIGVECVKCGKYDSPIKNWEKEFDKGCNESNISDPPSDTEWIKSFISNLLLQEKAKWKEKIEVFTKKESNLAGTLVRVSELLALIDKL